VWATWLALCNDLQERLEKVAGLGAHLCNDRRGILAPGADPVLAVTVR
jgi:hypothetical protein